jgi:hypothetical protein
MNSIEAEVAELRSRVARLEAQLAALTRSSAPPPTAPVERAPVGDAPPVIAPAQPRAPLAPAPGFGARMSEVPSTVWIAGVGAVIFLIGIIYGLTVSIQRGVITEPMRVGAGLAFGVLAGAVATRLLLAGRRALGVTLLAVGVGAWTFALYFGARSVELFPVGLGFAGAALATAMAGWLAARVRSDGALAVALATGLAAPLAFSSGQGTLAALLAYFAALSGAQLAVHYLTGTGVEWKLSRALGLAGVWLVALASSPAARLGAPELAVLATWGLAALGVLLAWLPRHPERPAEFAGASVLVLVAAAFGTWIIWGRAHWEREYFAAVLGALGVVSLGLRRLGRTRDGAGEPFLLAALGFVFLAVPVAWEWRWVTLGWGVGALLLAEGARRFESPGEGRLALAATIATVAGSAVWFVQAVFQTKGDRIFLNPVFAGAVLSAAAWTTLVRNGVGRGLAFAAAQAVAVNALAWELARAVPSVSGAQATLPLGALLATLVYASAGAAQWLRGVLYEAELAQAKALRLAGYAWLGVAAVKLLGYDLENRDLLFRAVAALIVGAIFIGAAFWADRVKSRR